MKRINIQDRLTIQLLLGVVLAVVGIALIWTGLFLHPVGEIHPSVLTAVGESFTFAGALIGVDYSYKYKRFKVEYDGKEEEE